MPRRDAYDCDCCQAKDLKTPIVLSLWVDRRMDAAGSMDNEYETLVLCAKCAAAFIAEVWNAFQKTQVGNAKLMELIRKAKGK